MQPFIDLVFKITTQGYLRALGLVNMTLPTPFFLWSLILVIFNDTSRRHIRDKDILIGLVICGALFLCGLVFWLVARRIEKRSQASS